MSEKSRVEFIVLSENESTSFLEYLREKGKKEYGDALILSYPKEYQDNDYSFNEFFQSPMRVNKFSHIYKGLFGVSLTDYKDKSSSNKLDLLFDYIEENRDMKFALFVFTHKKGEADELERRMERIFNSSGMKLVYSTFRKGTLVEKGERESLRFGY